ncbi:hypothetical protein LCGC14_1280900 [marine sediment metagenome]|uniref:Uncharacterized protein n=1 Tax=marine sediment metagenome TaxID=412755 RepID=A0A0F9KWU7_9ZZZZ|nr:hypothetical protein [bacterium]
MRIEFKFNSKSSGQNVPEAIRLAEKHGAVIENKFYKINFESQENKDLKKLFELVGNLKGSAISVNGEESVVANKFFYAVNCPEKLLCKGICKHIGIGYNNIEDFLEKNSENIENGIFSTSDENLIRFMSDYLEDLGEDKFKIDRDRFLEYFRIETEMEEKFCKKFDLTKVENEIEKLPKEIILVPYEEIEEEYVFSEVEKMIEKILIHCEISSEMSFNDVLRCSKAVSLLFGRLISTVIEDTDVYIFSFPSLKQIILAKLLFDEKLNEEQEEEELGYIITKVDNIFCASNPYSKLYFNLFNEDDPSIQEHFEKLKSLKAEESG